MKRVYANSQYAKPCERYCREVYPDEAEQIFKKAEAYYLKFIFCWVMHEQSILDAITNRLDTDNCKVTKISLTADEINLRNRLASDITRGIRTADIIDRSVARINLYSLLDTVKIDTSNKTVCEIANEIIAL